MVAGDKINKLTLVELLNEKAADTRWLGLFSCDCGNVKKLPIGRVSCGQIRSCGCLVGTNHTHGMKGSRTYESWGSAKRRCLCPSDKDYHRYGGKGITFHEPWADSFEQFLKDMGERPEGTTLDRIDGTKGYLPGNCKWSTPCEQARNTKRSYIWLIHGEMYESASEAAKKHNVSEQTINRWVKGYTDTRKAGKNTWGPKDGCSRIQRYCAGV